MTPAKTTHQGLIPAPAKYTPHPGNADLTYDAICKVLSDRAVDWSQFGPDEWHLLPPIAQAEGVGPLLYWHFKNENWPEGIPKETAAALMGQYYTTLGHNTLLFRELDRILAALAEANIPVILLKGADLAQTLYQDPALRPMSDLDLLVHREDVKRAVTLAQKLGYLEDTVELRPGLDWDIGHHIHLRNEKHVILELHWRLISGADDWRSPSAEWVWAQAERLDSKKPYQTLNPHAHILFISAHQAIQHGLADARLIWLYDVFALLQDDKNPVNWNELVSCSRETNWGASLNVVLSTVEKCFGYPVPASFLQELSETAFRDETLVRQKAGNGVMRSESVWQVVSALKWSSKIKLVLAFLFPSPTRMRYRYRPSPVWLWPLYYPYRWFDFAVDLTRTLARKMGMGKVHN